jgi:hypothetical protein
MILHLNTTPKQLIAIEYAAAIEGLNHFAVEALMSKAAHRFLENRISVSAIKPTDIYHDPVTDIAKSAIEWAYDFINHAPDAKTKDELWHWDRFDTFRNITADVNSGKVRFASKFRLAPELKNLTDGCD